MAGESLDYTSRYITVIKVFALVALVAGVAFLIAKAGSQVSAKAKLVGCQNNLRKLGTGLQMYADANQKQLPGWLTELYPRPDLFPHYVDDPHAFICPRDPFDGEKGCWPEWMKSQPEWRAEMDFANLDGTTLYPWEDQDSIPCSYVYWFNQYPTNERKFTDPLWSDLAKDAVEQYGRRVPVIQCFWHFRPGTPAGEAVIPSLLYDSSLTLTRVELYPRDWRGQPSE